MNGNQTRSRLILVAILLLALLFAVLISRGPALTLAPGSTDDAMPTDTDRSRLPDDIDIASPMLPARQVSQASNADRHPGADILVDANPQKIPPLAVIDDPGLPPVREVRPDSKPAATAAAEETVAPLESATPEPAAKPLAKLPPAAKDLPGTDEPAFSIPIARLDFEPETGMLQASALTLEVPATEALDADIGETELLEGEVKEVEEIVEIVEVTQASTSSEPPRRFQRLADDGEPAIDDQPWSCVRDNRNGLVWEVKTRDGDLRDAAHVYSWFDPMLAGASGVRDGGRCAGGIPCDTLAYREAVNRLGLCGFDDWRLPDKRELQSLVEIGDARLSATIDASFFPAAMASWYWSASPNQKRPEYAWYVLFRNGFPLNDLKARPKHIRLVRGERPVVAGDSRHDRS